MRKLVNKKIAAVAAGAIVVASAGAAYAYWTTSGSGTGDAAAAAPQATTELDFDQTALTAMFPGDTPQDLIVEVKNTGDQNAYVTSVSAYLTVEKAQIDDTSVGAAAGATKDKYAGPCSASDFLIGDADATVLAAAPGTEADAVELTWTAQDLAHTSGADDATGQIQFNNRADKASTPAIDEGVNQDGCKEAVVTVNYVAE